MIDIEKYKRNRLIKETKKLAVINPRILITGNIEKRENGCWEWKGPFFQSGYGRVILNGRSQRVHRVSFQLFNGEFDKSLFVCHKCDNPKCVNPKHLFVGTCKDNTHDSINKGRFYQKFEKGNNPDNKSIPDALALTIKNAFNKGSGYRHFTLKQIADMYEVPVQLVKDIKRGKSYINL